MVTKKMRVLKDREFDAQFNHNNYKRRHQDYDDNNSQDEEAPSELDATKGVTIQNDDGTVTELRSNSQFKNY